MKDANDDKLLISYKNWCDASELLEAEYSMINDNKYFNTLDMFYYKANYKNFKRMYVKNKKNFHSLIYSKMIYGVNDGFYNYCYKIPKSTYSYRTFSLLSCSARTMHTMIGLYLYKLSDRFVKNFFGKNSKIRSYYGGHIAYTTEDDKIITKNDNLYYFPSYKNFTKELLSASENHKSGKEHYIIKLDIKDYYDNINVSLFLSELSNQLSYKDKSDFNFNYDTITDISNFYTILMKKNVGIPQCQNDVTGSFMSSLFMKLVDLEIFESINSICYDCISSAVIYQYVDDTYIDLHFKTENNRIKISALISDIALRIEKKFKLQFNSKTAIYDLNDEEENKKFNKAVKYNSQSRFIITNENPLTVAHQIIGQIDKINQSNEFDSEKEDFVLGYIFDKKIKNVLMSSEIVDELEKLFLRINLDKYNVYAKYIVALASYSDKIKHIIKDYLNEYSDHKLPFYIEYYTKIDQKNGLKLLKDITESDMKNILNNYPLDHRTFSYLGFDCNQVESIRLYDYTNLIDQSILRKLAVETGNYSSALNHLINEVQLIVYYCKRCKKKNSKLIPIEKYDAEDIRIDISDMNPNSIIKVINAFNRRNNNLISHSNGKALTRDEYFSVEKNTMEFLSEFYKTII